MLTNRLTTLTVGYLPYISGLWLWDIILVTIHQKKHNGYGEEEKNNAGYGVEAALGVMLQHGFPASAVYPFQKDMSGKNDRTPYYNLNNSRSVEKPITQEY